MRSVLFLVVLFFSKVAAVRDESFEASGTLVKLVMDFFQEGFYEAQYGLRLDYPTETGDLFLPVEFDNFTNPLGATASEGSASGTFHLEALPLNSHVTVRGVRRPRRHGKQLTRDDIVLDVQTLDVARQKRDLYGRPSSTGELKVLVMMVTLVNTEYNFSTGPRCSKSDWEAVMWDSARSVDAVYNFSSNGMLRMPKSSGRVVSVEIEAQATMDRQWFCNPWAWSWKSLEAADAAGVSTASYDILHYAMPDWNLISCGWGGLGVLGGPESWSANCSSTYVSAHEIGHNIGFSHASRLDGQRVVEYGDNTDLMGVSDATFNALHRYQAGWLPQAGVIRVVANTGASQMFLIAPLNSDPTSLQYPMILQVPLPGSITQWISYRTASGLDSAVHAPNTVSVHLWSGDGDTVLQALVPLGGSFRSDEGRFTLEVLNALMPFAHVRVTFDASVLCPTTLLTQNFGSGLGSWTVTSTSPQIVPRLVNATGMPSGDATAVLLSGTPRGVAALQTLRSPPVTLSGTGQFTLQFYMKYQTEGTMWFSDGGYCSEGGVVSVVINGVATQLDASLPYAELSVYRDLGNPLGGRSAWCSPFDATADTLWTPVSVDVSAYASQTVQFDVSYGTDAEAYWDITPTGFTIGSFRVVRSAACFNTSTPGQSTGGGLNYGLAFRGDNYLYLNRPATTLSTWITISFYVRANYTRTGTSSMVMVANGVPGTSGVAVVVLPNGLGLGLQVGAVTHSFNRLLPRDQWTFVSVVSPSAGQWKLYIDAVELSELWTDTVSPASRFYVGGQSTNSRAFVGAIDSVQVWNLPRTREQLMTDRNEASLTGSEPGLALLLAFNDLRVPPSMAGSITSSATLSANGAVVYVLRGTIAVTTRVAKSSTGTTSTGTTSTGTTSTGTTALGTTGVRGTNSAFIFRGDTYLYLTQAASSFFRYTISCHVWVEYTRPFNPVVLFSNGIPGSTGAALLLLPTFGLGLQVNRTVHALNVSLPRSRWTFLSVEQVVGSWTLYVDAVRMTTVYAPSADPVGRFYMGGDSTTSRMFVGYMDNVQVWETSRTTAQLRDDMREEVTAHLRDLAVYIPFNDLAEPPTTLGYMNLGPVRVNGVTSYVARSSLFTPTSGGVVSTTAPRPATSGPSTSGAVTVTGGAGAPCPQAVNWTLNYPGYTRRTGALNLSAPVSESFPITCDLHAASRRDVWIRTSVLPAGSRVTIATCDEFTNFDTVIYVYRGDCHSAPVACNDDSPTYDCVHGYGASDLSLVMSSAGSLLIRVTSFAETSPDNNFGLVVFTELAVARCPRASYWPIAYPGTTQLTTWTDSETIASNFSSSCGETPDLWRDLWYSTRVLPANSSVTVDTCDEYTEVDTMIEVFVGGCDLVAACNDDAVIPCPIYSPVGSFLSRVSFVMPRADFLLIRIGGWRGEVGAYGLHITTA